MWFHFYVTQPGPIYIAQLYALRIHCHHINDSNLTPYIWPRSVSTYSTQSGFGFAEALSLSVFLLAACMSQAEAACLMLDGSMPMYLGSSALMPNVDVANNCVQDVGA